MQGQPKKTLYVVTGGTASLGNAMLRRFAQDPDGLCYGMYVRPRTDLQDSDNLKWRQCDLMDHRQTFDVVKTILDETDDLGVEEIVLVHAVGAFAYEGEKTGLHAIWAAKKDWGTPPYPGLDHQIWMNNVDTFRNITNAVFANLQKRRDQNHPAAGRPLHIKIGTVGSISEPYRVPLWFSFIAAKERVRTVLQAMPAAYTHGPQCVSTFYLRTSTINTDSERDLRPHADMLARRYWLTSDEVAERTRALLGRVRPGTLLEEEMVTCNPSFSQSPFLNIPALKARWDQQTGAELPKAGCPGTGVHGVRVLQL